MKIYSNEIIRVKLEKRQKRKKILNIIYWVLAGFLLISCALVFYQKFIKKSNGVSLFGYSAYIVVSGSMHPYIMVGDMVVVSKSAEKDINENDIVTFIDEKGNTVTHRVTKKMIVDGVTKYATKGDGNGADDVGLITYNDIQGKFCFKLHQAGRLFVAVFTPLGMIMLALIAIMIYVNSSRLSDRRLARHSIRERYLRDNVQQENSTI